MVHDNFMVVSLEKPPNKEIITLGDALHTYIQWPKRDIALDPVVPRSPHDDHASPIVLSITPPQPPLQKASVSASVEMAPKKHEKHVESSSRKTISTRGSKAKSKKIKMSHKPGTYSLGMPLVSETMLHNVGLVCWTLHDWYMQQTDETREDWPTGFTVSYTENHFLHKAGYFIMGFEDLFDLFNLKAFDASLLRCWTLRMMQEAGRSRQPMGFLDPHLISEQTINYDPPYVQKYITNALFTHSDKDYILVPYNQGYHWILLVIVPKWNKVIYLDSLVGNQHDFTIVEKLLDRLFSAYVEGGGTHNEHGATLRHKTKFPCHQQLQQGEVCAFYVCHHMMEIMSAKTKDLEGMTIEQSAYHLDLLADIRAELAIFIQGEIIRQKGEFYPGDINLL